MNDRVYITLKNHFIGDKIRKYGSSSHVQNVLCHSKIESTVWDKDEAIVLQATMITAGLIFDQHSVAGLRKAASCEGRNGFIVASGTAEWAGMSRNLLHIGYDTATHNVLFGLIQIAAGKKANELGYSDYIVSDASACASSYKAIFEAFYLIKTGYLDRCVVVGWDDQINVSTLEAFGQSGAFYSLKDEESGLIPSAFDDINYGFRIAHGGGFLLLESEKSMKETGNIPIAEIVTAGFTGEANRNPIASGVAGYKKLFELLSKDVDIKRASFIKTHGTGTKVNNVAEKTAMVDFFGNDFIATSYKPEIGHTMGASGVVEISIAIDDGNINKVRGISNRTVSDERFLSDDIDITVDSFLAIGAGMGNAFGGAFLKIIK